MLVGFSDHSPLVVSRTTKARVKFIHASRSRMFNSKSFSEKKGIFFVSKKTDSKTSLKPIMKHLLEMSSKQGQLHSYLVTDTRFMIVCPAPKTMLLGVTGEGCFGHIA